MFAPLIDREFPRLEVRLQHLAGCIITELEEATVDVASGKRGVGLIPFLLRMEHPHLARAWLDAQNIVVQGVREDYFPIPIDRIPQRASLWHSIQTFGLINCLRVLTRSRWR